MRSSTVRSPASALSCTSGGIGARPRLKPHWKRTGLNGRLDRRGYKTIARIVMVTDIAKRDCSIIAPLKLAGVFYPPVPVKRDYRNVASTLPSGRQGDGQFVIFARFVSSFVSSL